MIEVGTGSPLGREDVAPSKGLANNKNWVFWMCSTVGVPVPSAVLGYVLTACVCGAIHT